MPTNAVPASKAPASAMVLVGELILVASLMTAPPVALRAPARERDGWCLICRGSAVRPFVFPFVFRDPLSGAMDYKEMHFLCKLATVHGVLRTRYSYFPGPAVRHLSGRIQFCKVRRMLVWPGGVGPVIGAPAAIGVAAFP